MELYISRHTKVAIDQGICYGQSDIPLLDSFPIEAQTIQTKLPSDIEVVFSSPLSRCQQLAQIFSPSCILEEALLEMSFGDWELQAWDAIPMTVLQPWMDDFVHHQTPNGENMQMLYERVAAFINKLRAESYNKVLLVTHAGVMRCIWANLLGIPLKNAFKIAVPYHQVLQINLGKQADYDQIKTL